MSDLAVDKERAENAGPNAHWAGRENTYLDRWNDAGEDEDDEPVMQFRGMGGGFSARRVDDGEIDEDENREFDVDAEDDIIDRGSSRYCHSQHGTHNFGYR